MSEFVVRDNEAVAEAAAATFFWQTFRRHYLWTFLGGAILFSAMIVWTLRTVGDTWYIGTFAFLLSGTLAYVPIFYFARRSAAAQMVRKHPERRVRVTPVDITISTSDESTTLPWRIFQSIWEYPDFILLVQTRHYYWWLPKAGMPDDAVDTIRQVAARAAV
jgi:hypothetical protein